MFKNITENFWEDLIAVFALYGAAQVGCVMPITFDSIEKTLAEFPN